MKQKYAYIFLIFLYSFNVFSQAAPIIQATIDTPLPACQLGDCTTLIANFPTIKQTTSYTVSSIVYNPSFPFLWDGVASHKINVTGDDFWSPTITLPFNFCFYGNSYNQVLIGTNGVITFDQTTQAPSGYCPWSFSATIPNVGFPIKNAIYGVYQDTDMATPSPLADPLVQNVNYYFLDTGVHAAPNRILVVNFNELPQYSCGISVGLQTSQIVLYESTNIIDVNVFKRTTCTGWQGGVGVIGIQNLAGNNAVVPPGRNTGAWAATNESWRFSPSGAIVNPSSIIWKKDNVLFGNINPMPVCPTGPANYSATLTYSPPCGNPFTATSTNVLVDIEGPLPVLDPQDINICTSGPLPYTVNINQNAYMLNGASPSDYDLVYYEVQADAINDMPNFIPNPNAYILSTAPPKTLYVRIFDTNSGCFNVRPFDIIGGTPTGTISYPATPYCTTISAPQPITPNTLTVGGTYSATPSGLIIDSITGEITPYGSTPGIYTVKYEITGACPYSTTTPIEIIACNCVVASTNSGSICNGDTFNLNATNLAGYTYSWTGPNGFTSTLQNPIGIPTPTGTPPFVYEVTATATVGIDVCTSQTTLVVNALPTISGILSVCTGLQTQLTASLPPAVTNSWVSSDLSIATVDALGVVTGVSAGNVFITFTTIDGCSSTVSVVVNDSPTITGTLSVCSGLQTQLSGSGTAATVNAWISSNTTVATVDGTGLVTGVSAGTTIITYTNSSGCKATQTINVYALPTISGNLSVCVGLQTQLTGSATAATTNAWLSSNPAVASVNGTGLITGIALGTTIISYTNSNGCVSTALITVNSLPTITGLLIVCSGFKTQLTGSATAATVNAWISSNTAVATVDGTGLVTGVSAGTATITYTNSNGCIATASVTVVASPTITGILSVCVGLQTQLTGSPTPAGVNAWVSSNTAVATVNGSGLVTAVSVGTATITYTNSNGCFNTVTVTVNALPTITGTLSVCAGLQTQLTGSAAAAATNAWISSNTSVATISATGMVTGVSAGTAIITYTNSNGCTITANVIVNPLPTITGTLSVCAGTQTQLTGSASAATVNPWTSSNTTIATVDGTGLVTGVAGGTTIITYTNSNGCIITATVTVIPLPSLVLTSAAATATQSVCINTPITTIIYTIGGSATNASVTGLPMGVAGVFSGSTFTISGTPTLAGTYPFTVNTTGGCAPDAALIGTITVNPLSTIVLTSAIATESQTICINTPIVNITYLVGSGATGATITSGAFPSGITGVFDALTNEYKISGIPTTSGTFNYQITTIGGCPTTPVNGVIVVNPDVTLALTSAAGSNNQTTCLNDPITTITYLIGNGATGAYLSAGALPTGATSNFSALTGIFTISGIATSLGNYSFTVTTTGGCATAALSGVINVTPSATIALSSAASTSPQSVCVDDALITITYLVANGATGASITSGSLPAGVTTSFSVDTFTISGIPTVSGIFNYEVTTSGGCSSASISGTITVNPLPNVTLPQNGFICVDVAGNPLAGSTYELKTNLSAANFSFKWSDATGVIAGETSNSYEATLPGNYSVIVTDLNTLCTSTASATIAASLPPSSAVTSDTSYFLQDQVVTVTVTPTGIYEYQLDSGAFQDSNQFEDISAGPHTITIRDKYSCGSISTTIYIVDYPKFFTPNGDGYNETWNIPELANQPVSKIYIYDRYGKLLKQIVPSGDGWNGTYNGKDLPSSDYWFKVFFTEKEVSKEFGAHFSLKR